LLSEPILLQREDEEKSDAERKKVIEKVVEEIVYL